MSTINIASHAAYYQLPQQNNASPGSGGIAGALAGMLQSSTAGSNAYLLDLSPLAQQYLNTQPDNTGFTLTPDEHKTLEAILAKYIDAPFNQDTFNRIQDDLAAARLAPDQLANKNRIASFNSTEILINALNGVNVDINTMNADGNTAEQSKINAYMEKIVNRWQELAALSTNQGVPSISAAA